MIRTTLSIPLATVLALAATAEVDESKKLSGVAPPALKRVAYDAEAEKLVLSDDISPLADGKLDMIDWQIFTDADNRTIVALQGQMSRFEAGEITPDKLGAIAKVLVDYARQHDVTTSISTEAAQLINKQGAIGDDWGTALIAIDTEGEVIGTRFTGTMSIAHDCGDDYVVSDGLRFMRVDRTTLEALLATDTRVEELIDAAEVDDEFAGYEFTKAIDDTVFAALGENGFPSDTKYVCVDGMPGTDTPLRSTSWGVDALPDAVSEAFGLRIGAAEASPEAVPAT